LAGVQVAAAPAAVTDVPAMVLILLPILKILWGLRLFVRRSFLGLERVRPLSRKGNLNMTLLKNNSINLAISYFSGLFSTSLFNYFFCYPDMYHTIPPHMWIFEIFACQWNISVESFFFFGLLLCFCSVLAFLDLGSAIRLSPQTLSPLITFLSRRFRSGAFSRLRFRLFLVRSGEEILQFFSFSMGGLSSCSVSPPHLVLAALYHNLSYS